MGIKIVSKDRTEEFGVISIPGRKNKALYVIQGTVMYTLAFFRSDEDAEKFQEILNWMADATKKSAG